MAENRSHSSQAFELVKTGLIVYLGIEALGLIGNIAGAFQEPKNDAGTSQNNCDAVIANLTYPLIQYDAFSDQIQNAIWETGPFAMYERDDVIAAALMAMNNIDDVTMLICAYWIRGAKDAASATLNLVDSVEKYLDSDYKEAVNEDYQNRGINFIWL